MKAIIGAGMTAIILAVAAGCAGKAAAPPVEMAATGQKASGGNLAYPGLQDWLSRQDLAITAGPDGRMDHRRAFQQGAVIAYGEGASSAAAGEPGKKRLSAQRAAEVDAQRNLALFFAGHLDHGEVAFTSYTVKLEALVKGAVTVAEEYDPSSGRAAALVSLDLKGARGFAR